ncbi:hypothetical protein D9M71_253840 [compost metagenome]
MTGSLPSGSKLSPGAPSEVPFSIQSSPSLPMSCSLALLPRMKSLPWPPMASEASSPVTMKSLPKPPITRLMPLPPWMTSLPSPPWMLSSPPMSVMMSSPAPPRIWSLPLPPSMMSLPPSPQMVSSPSPAMRISTPSVPPSTTCSPPEYCRKLLSGPAVSGLSRLTPSGSSRPVPRPVYCRLWSTSRVQLGVENTRPGRWMALVLAMIILANELLSSSAFIDRPAVRSR